MGVAGVFVNSVLLVLNLLPLPPLDGGRLLVRLLPGPWARRLARIEPYGRFIVLVLLALGVLAFVLAPPVQAVGSLARWLSGMPEIYDQLLLAHLLCVNSTVSPYC